MQIIFLIIPIIDCLKDNNKMRPIDKSFPNMKRLIRTIFVTAILLVSVTDASKANPVDLQTARNVAYNFLRSLSQQPIGDLTDITASTPWHEFYTFNFECGTAQQNEPKSGFIIVSADDCVIPILGYSLSNRFETKDIPDHILSWMQCYEDQIAWLRKHEMKESLLQSSSSDSCTQVREAWERLLTATSEPGRTNVLVGPLLSTTWDQGQYYNNLCPYGSGGRTYTGCVATAAAQIMKYWNHPTTGRGSHSYTYRSYGTLSANFGSTTYNWSDMPDSLTATSPSTAVNAVATLIYHVGVAVETSYGTNFSGAYMSNFGSISFPSVENALPTYFKYSPVLHSVFIGDYTIDEWISLLRTEIDNNRPILYSGSGPSSGHAFVCDGYNSATGHFHINWGWSGRCDDYFTIGALNPCPNSTNASNHTYNLYNSAIIGIQPQTCWDTTTVITISSDYSGHGSVYDSGTYYYGDTVSVRANANSGKRFVRWSDGYRFNPRQFVVTCESNSITAQFEALGGDTLSYCTSSTELESFGSSSTGSDKYWGIRLPSTTLTNGHDLREVQMYAVDAGTYTLNVYRGGTSSSNKVYTSNFTISSNDVNDWYSINLSTPVEVDGTQDIYITFYNNDVNYPAAMTYCSGNSDALLWGSYFNSISSSWDYSFMIRGIFGEYVCPVTSGDTISYCDDRSWQTTIGTGGSLYWGISFDTSCLVGHDSIEQVLLYVLYSGTYTMNIFSGNDTSPTTLLYTDTYIINDSLTYFSCILDSLLPIDHSQQLWVTFHSSGIPSPAIACNYVGDPHSNWVSTNGTSWSPLHVIAPTLPYSWMIKVVIHDSIDRDTCIGVGSIPYTTGFETTEHNECWNFVNGSCTNQWIIGSATNNTMGGSRALYISNNDGANNNYSISNAQSSVIAYRTIQFDTGRYSVSFDWKAYGEASFDYLRVALIPAAYILTSNTSWDTCSLLTGFITLDGNNLLNTHTAWTTHTTDVSIPTSGLYNIVFYWHNDDNMGYNPPAAIDNIIIQELIECITNSVDIYVSSCDTYTWNDSIYTISSIDSFTAINSQG